MDDEFLPPNVLIASELRPTLDWRPKEKPPVYGGFLKFWSG